MIKDIKYWAGLADADGSFNLAMSKRGDDRYYGQVSFTLYQKNKKILEEFSAIFDRPILQGKGCSYITITGTKARNFMQQVKNHLVVKKHLVENLLKEDKKFFNSVEKSEINKLIRGWRYHNKSDKVRASRKWACGFIDGDGSLSASFNKKTNYVEFKLSVVSHKDQDIGLQLLKKLLKGYIVDDSNCRRWQLNISSNNIEKVSDVLKHLKIKDKQHTFIKKVLSNGLNKAKNGATGRSNFLLKEYMKYLNSMNSLVESPATTKSLDEFLKEFDVIV
jgi:hypothetical protein